MYLLKSVLMTTIKFNDLGKQVSKSKQNKTYTTIKTNKQRKRPCQLCKAHAKSRNVAIK